MNQNLRLKVAVEDVRRACFNGDRITGTDIKKKYSISTHLLPVMIEAGYIQKMKGLKYKWKVQAEILPVMLKVIQDGITKTNMEYLKKSQARSKFRTDLKTAAENSMKERQPYVPTPTRSVSFPEPKTSPEITSKPIVLLPSPGEGKYYEITSSNETGMQAELKTVGNNEIIKKLESVNTNIANLSTTIHQKWTQMEFKDREIAELKRNRKSIVFRLFGLPIFAISRS